MKSCSRKQLTQEYPFTRLPPEMPGQQGFEPGPTAQSRHPLERNADNWQKGQEGHNPAQQQQHSPEQGSLLNVGVTLSVQLPAGIPSCSSMLLLTLHLQVHCMAQRYFQLLCYTKPAGHTYSARCKRTQQRELWN